MTQVVPPINSGSSLVVKYRDALKTYFPNEPTSFVSLEGDIAATLFVDGLKKTAEPLTMERVVDALNHSRQELQL